MNHKPAPAPPVNLVSWARTRLASEDLAAWAENILLELCQIDSTIRQDIDALRASEEACFEIMIRELGGFLEDTHAFDRCALDPAIAGDDYYTLPHYAGPLWNQADKVYRLRHNLLVRASVPSKAGHRWLFNAHVDTVPPHIAPRRIPGGLAGRGTADDKGGFVVMLLLARLLREWAALTGTDLRDRVDFTCSIDEEVGGNGSLGLLPYLNLEKTTVVVLEPTRLQIHPANRGALWFQVYIRPKTGRGRQRAHLLAARVVRELYEEGRAIRSSSPHPLFDAEDVQTCCGILTPYGQFASSACEEVTFHFAASASMTALEIDAFIRNEFKQATDEAGLKVDRGVAGIEPGPDGKWAVRIAAVGGHMGSRSRDTDAVIKAAMLMERLERSRPGSTSWPEYAEALILEGGQGFLPSLTLAQVRERLRSALDRAFRDFAPESPDLEAGMSFDKIHNAAYSSAEDAKGAAGIERALKAFQPEFPVRPPRGWQASCDARIFARTCTDVVTFGAGSLDVAHSPDEHVLTEDILRTAGTLLVAVSESEK